MLSFCKFEKESDYNSMRSIVQHNCSKTGHLHPQIHIGNLDFERYAFKESPGVVYETIWFVTDSKSKIGFITAEQNEFYITVLPEYKCCLEEVLDFVEKNLYSEGTVVTTEANSEEKLLTNILKRRGYIRTENYRYSGICDLSKIPIQLPILDGYRIRSTRKQDVIRRAELFNLATGGIGTTAQRYESMMNSLSYSDALDLVAETKSAEIIAYCTIWDDPVSKIAILEPVACAAEHRRKGITKSLLLHGMHLIKERGTKYIYVGTGGKNIPSQMLYKSVGFIDYGKDYEYEKIV